MVCFAEYIWNQMRATGNLSALLTKVPEIAGDCNILIICIWPGSNAIDDNFNYNRVNV
jgi:hypothetical protein